MSNHDSFRNETLESIDDYIYYLKSMVHAAELISALFVVCAGLKEATTGHWSLLNSVVLLIHCYFNVWVRIKSGWRSFLLRQVSLFFSFHIRTKIHDLFLSKNDTLKIWFFSKLIFFKLSFFTKIKIHIFKITFF